MVEQFFRAHQYTVSAVGAFATVAVVIVSLLLAFVQRRANRTSLKAFVSRTVIIHDTIDPKNRPSYISVNVTNTGILPLRIPFSFFHWRAPFRRGTYMVNPLDWYGTDTWIQKKQYPVEILPRTAQTFFVSTAKTFLEELSKIMHGKDAIRPWQFRRLRVVIVTDDGAQFHTHVGKEVRQELERLAAQHTGHNSPR
ncbi:MAG: hypothetical protein KGJ66_03470 [Alphaproteobacteria bacterium]|nr:hypothetical protein [Alphaproteobacteria bacterium]